MSQTEEKPGITAKHRQVRRLLDQASETEIRVTFLPGGTTRVDIAPHTEPSAEPVSWKEKLKTIKGIWKDREGIVEEMESIRREADRSFVGRDD